MTEAQATAVATAVLDAMQAGDPEAALSRLSAALREQKRQGIMEGLGNPGLGFEWSNLRSEGVVGERRLLQADIRWKEGGEQRQGTIDLEVIGGAGGPEVSVLESR